MVALISKEKVRELIAAAWIRWIVLGFILMTLIWTTLSMRQMLTPTSIIEPSTPRHSTHKTLADEQRDQGKYLVMSAAVGYNFYSYERFITTLRNHYDGDVVLFVGKRDMLAASLVERCFNSSVRIAQLDSVVQIGAKGDRYVAYAEYCRNYTACLATDFRDVFFQGNPFKNLPPHYDLVLSEEEPSGMAHTGSNRRWITSCWGAEFLNSVADIPPICSGTIYGTPSGFKVLKDLMIDEMKRSAQKRCTARDQGHLNYLLLSNSFPFPVLRQRRGYGMVNTLARLTPPQARLWMEAGGVKNEDGSLSPVVHQYDRFGKLEILLENLLQAGFRNDVRKCTRSEMALYCIQGMVC